MTFRIPLEAKLIRLKYIDKELSKKEVPHPIISRGSNPVRAYDNFNKALDRAIEMHGELLVFYSDTPKYIEVVCDNPECRKAFTPHDAKWITIRYASSFDNKTACCDECAKAIRENGDIKFRSSLSPHSPL